ncbi:hypothetical protein JQ615_07610 [Bradyrhizobium jicamae]|uniref:Uncharacterized protein n=1 Tax=Bradyrhizobium jicamae TaxID=280332 RepID=A0ABS5FEZ9_9BRAD|nr:hypothetical protein [Bradyrhizobium jicamae]MBR0795249.1 hypothetical protein [Bradyrhizobium jicamae]
MEAAVGSDFRSSLLTPDQAEASAPASTVSTGAGAFEAPQNRIWNEKARDLRAPLKLRGSSMKEMFMLVLVGTFTILSFTTILTVTGSGTSLGKNEDVLLLLQVAFTFVWISAAAGLLLMQVRLPEAGEPDVNAGLEETRHPDLDESAPQPNGA